MVSVPSRFYLGVNRTSHRVHGAEAPYQCFSPKNQLSAAKKKRMKMVVWTPHIFKDDGVEPMILDFFWCPKKTGADSKYLRSEHLGRSKQAMFHVEK